MYKGVSCRYATYKVFSEQILSEHAHHVNSLLWCFTVRVSNQLYFIGASIDCIICSNFLKGDDFKGFEADRQGSEGPVCSRQNPSKGKIIMTPV